jgi:hypothetical protein
MRWLVEVTSLGKSDKESLFLDADSWQKALQAARAQRGDNAPMSGFSIELLDDGCRAVDPVSRVRYDVHKAPEDAPGARSQPPRAASQAPAPAVPAAAATPSHVASAPRAPVVPSARPQPAAAPSRVPAPAAGAGMQTAHVAPSAAPQPPPHVMAPAVQVPAQVQVQAHVAPRADVAATVPSQIIFKREQDPTDAMPLAYREYVYAVPPATTEAMAETLLATQLEMVRASLERLPPGKLVNMAAFDVVFQGKPPVPPLVTLAWKDWRGAPVVSYPRRAPAPQPVVPPAPATAPVLQQAPAPVMAPPPAAAPVPPPPAFVAQVAQPVAHAVAPSFPVQMPVPGPQQAFAPPVIAPTFQAPAPVAAPAAAPAPSAQSARPPSGSMRAAPGTRARTEDLVADLFEAMHDLHFVRDAIEGGEFCLTLAMDKLPSRAGIVHLYDIDKREFLVTSTRGAGTGKLLLRRHAESDAILQAAMNRRRAIVIADGSHSGAVAVERYEVLGGVRSLMIAPVMEHGRFLGAIELINPLDGLPFTDAEGNALNYIAGQFAEFLSSHGIVTDPERISARQLPEG